MNTFFDLVDRMIELNKNNRKIINKLYFGETSWIEDFCSVRVDCGRRTGKSYYIATRSTEKDLIIVPTYNMVRMMEDKKPKARVISIAEFGVENMQDMKYETIYFDEPHLIFMFAENRFDCLNTIYEKLYRSDIDQTFVFLGK